MLPFVSAEILSAETLSATVALAVTVAAAFSDLKSGRIPNWLTGCGMVAGCLLAVMQSGDVLATSLIAGSAAAGALFAVRLMGQMAYAQPGMGWGDVKLAAALGACMGWNALWALYLAAVFGAAWGMLGRATGRTERLQRIRFAPFIAAGVVVALIVSGSQILGWSGAFGMCILADALPRR